MTHMDLKGANIMYDSEKKVATIIDFGAALLPLEEDVTISPGTTHIPCLKWWQDKVKEKKNILPRDSPENLKKWKKQCVTIYV